jgi:hypothetical protein
VPLTPFSAIVGPDFPLSVAAIVSGILKSTASETGPGEIRGRASAIVIEDTPEACFGSISSISRRLP